MNSYGETKSNVEDGITVEPPPTHAPMESGTFFNIGFTPSFTKHGSAVGMYINIMGRGGKVVSVGGYFIIAFNPFDFMDDMGFMAEYYTHNTLYLHFSFLNSVNLEKKTFAEIYLDTGVSLGLIPEVDFGAMFKLGLNAGTTEAGLNLEIGGLVGMKVQAFTLSVGLYFVIPKKEKEEEAYYRG